MAGTEEALETSEFLESLGIEADSLPGLTSTHPKNRAQLGTSDYQNFIQSCPHLPPPSYDSVCVAADGSWI